MSFSLALSGGGCRGAAHVGVLAALQDAKLTPCAISGSSAGAIVAGLYAYGYTPEQLAKICRELERNGEKLIDFNVFGIAAAVSQLARRRPITLSGLLKGDRLRALLKQLTKGCPMSQVSLPLCITSVDLSSGETVAFSQRKPIHALTNVRWEHDVQLYEAIYASCCVPVIFTPPISMNGVLVDGGVTDNLPVNLLLACDAPNIIAVDISENYALDGEGIFEIAWHSLSAMSRRLRDCTVRGERLLIRPKLPEDAGLFTFSLMSDCIQAGYTATKELTDLIHVLSK
ncbi:MAG TPA: patatin-like phospholipase family protein [Clostridia bacterium]|nr:patatin-like phospholipase family protein [Clostridia bacterium]